MIKARLGSDLDAVVYRMFPFVREIRVAPDVLTLAGAGVSLLAAWAFSVERSFLAGLLLMLAGFFDLIDGVVARQQGVSSSAGAFFDSSIDRLSDLLIFGGIAVARAHAADATRHAARGVGDHRVGDDELHAGFGGAQASTHCASASWSAASASACSSWPRSPAS